MVQQLVGAVDYVNTQQRGGDLPSDNQSFGSYQAGFNLGWELDFWGRFRRGIESADAAFFASIADQQDVQVLLTAQIADLYYAHRTIELQIKIARENAAIQKRSYEITERIFKSGEQGELDRSPDHFDPDPQRPQYVAGPPSGGDIGAGR